MKQHISIFIPLILVLAASAAQAREAFVSLDDYVTNADSIILCTVTSTSDDGSVSAKVEQTIKGEDRPQIKISGDTGHCVLQGPVSQFMQPENQYLVFLFTNDTVGRLGGILCVKNDIVHAGFIDGFDTKSPKNPPELPVKNAIDQIKMLLNKKKDRTKE